MSANDPPRKKWSGARWAAAISAGLALIAIAMAGAAWWLIESMDLKQVVAGVESAAEDVTGRKLTIGSAPQFSFTPMLKLVVRDIALGNMEGGSRSEMLKIDQLEIGISLTPLLRGRRPGLNITLVEPNLLLEISDRGERNWAFKLSPEEALARLKQAVAILDGKISLEAARIERASMRFDDRHEGRNAAVTAARAVLQREKSDDYELELDGAVNGQPVSLRGGFRMTGPGELMPVRIRASLPGAAVSAEGAVRPAWPTPGSDIKLLLEIQDASRLGEALGVTIGKLPPARLEARLQGTDEGLRADPLNLTMGRSTLAGGIEVSRFGPRPLIRANLDAPVLDLAELLPASRSAPQAGGTDGRVFPATRLPLDLLRSLDAESQLKIRRLVLPGSPAVDGLQVRLSLANGRLRVDPFQLAVGPGSINGRLGLDASSSKAAVEADVQAKGVPLDSLLALAGLKAGVTGAPTDMTIRLAASGDSLRAWMTGLNGHARIVSGPGRLPGKLASWSGSVIGRAIDIANPYRTADDGAALKCVVLNVPVQRGILAIKDTVAAETDKVVGSVAGTVDLGRERVDLVLNSQAAGGMGPGLADFAGVARVTGSLAKPELAVNVQGAAVAGLRVGAAIVTFGATEIAGSLMRKAVPPHPCQAALGVKTGKKDENAPAGAAAETPAPAKKPGFFGRMLGK